MGLLGSITDELGVTDSGAGAKAAERAGAVSAASSREAREQLGKGYYGSRKYLGSGFNEAKGLLSPTSTAQGYTSELMNLMGGGGLDPLINERRRGLEAELANQGLTRSGAGVTQMAQLPIDVVMGIEQGLYGRKGGLADLAMQRGAGMANLNTGYRSDMANSYMGSGANQASSILAAAQANAADRAAVTNWTINQQSLLNEGAGTMMSGMGSMMGGG